MAGIATSRARLARFGAAVSVERCGEPVGASAEISLVSERVDAEHFRVQLVTPSEPLAWAIDPAFVPGRPFHAAWHSERVPGVRPRPAATEAIVEARGVGTIAVRVFTDDGAVGTKVLERERAAS